LPSDQRIQSNTTHPVLGPGVALYDNRGRTRLRLVCWIVLIPLGFLGVWLGRGDVVTGSTLAGLAQALAGVIVIAYAARAALEDVRRLAQPVRIVIARDGFALVPGGYTVSWDEVETISDPRSRGGYPRTLRVQFVDPAGFRRRHTLSLIEWFWLRVNRGDLNLGDGTAMPVSDAERLMRRQLAEFHRRRQGLAAGKTARSSRDKR
jgi:hypothetical protein